MQSNHSVFDKCNYGADHYWSVGTCIKCGAKWPSNLCGKPHAGIPGTYCEKPKEHGGPHMAHMQDPAKLVAWGSRLR